MKKNHGVSANSRLEYIKKIMGTELTVYLDMKKKMGFEIIVD